MDDGERAELWGAITALNHLLEHQWTFLLSMAEDPIAKTRKMRGALLKEFDFPPRPEDVGEWPHIVRQHALSVLEEFWDRVEARALPKK